MEVRRFYLALIQELILILKLKGWAFSLLLSLLMSHFSQITFSSISNGLVRLLPRIQDLLRGYSPLQYFRCWHLPVLYRLQCPLSKGWLRGKGLWIINMMSQLNKPKSFSTYFSPFLLFFRSMCSRLLPIQPFLLCCPSLAASVLPLFFHVGMMCVMYICMVLYSSLPKISLAFPFLLALYLIFCLAYLITLPVSNLFSCPWSRYPYILQTTQMDIQVLLHPHFRPFCHWNKPQI